MWVRKIASRKCPRIPLDTIFVSAGSVLEWRPWWPGLCRGRRGGTLGTRLWRHFRPDSFPNTSEHFRQLSGNFPTGDWGEVENDRVALWGMGRLRTTSLVVSGCWTRRMRNGTLRSAVVEHGACAFSKKGKPFKGLEPLTIELKVQRSTDWANKALSTLWGAWTLDLWIKSPMLYRLS